MSLFSPNKDFKVRGVILKLLNSNCPELVPEIQDSRGDKRINLAIVVAVVPVENGKLQRDRAFTAVTKDFSSTGVAIVTEQVLRLGQAILGFRIDGEIVFLLAQARHLDPMGGGLFQIGFELLEVVSTGDYPGLEDVDF
jgi:PilZ domain